MNGSTRRFIAMLGVLAFLVFWIWGVIALRGLFRPGMLLDLLFFAIGGIGWGVPLYPLFKWAESGKD
ncbi:DUF2842 domain-containing protein [Brevundimonas sp. FT23028]|uniref:DUF2842 domain-containing protein n=1 Tax=Brevundimonas sp. FT23028 TaxID=3393748 RepID=UPI003B585EE8